jgi:hypothetical protein
MKTNILKLSVILIAWTTSLSAQITRQQADAIARDYVQNNLPQPAGTLYVKDNASAVAGIEITTSNDESLRAAYACWAYYINENEPLQRRYFFVNGTDGNLLEVIASADVSPMDETWAAMDATGGGAAVQTWHAASLPYPNPVNNLLTLPCNGENTPVEIYDLKGTRLFSGILSDENACQLNVSFLNAGVYMVNVLGETFKIIKELRN